MLGLVFALPFLLLLVVFALSNAGTVQLGLWPTDLSIDAPLSLAVLGAAGLFFILGAIVVWIGSLNQRRRARRAESRVRALERELEGLRPRPNSLVMPGSSLRTIDG
jgi:putative membrane protein